VSAVIVFLLLVLAWVLTSGRLTARSVTGPIVLTAAGFVLASAADVQVSLDTETVRALIEVTLAVVLFGDASAIGLRWFRTEWQYPARLLGLGLPLTVALGGLAAWWVFPGIALPVAFLVAAALAPTDAALGASIIEDERMPAQFRKVISVESGLNDGLATPIVAFFITAVVASELGEGSRPLRDAVLEICIAVVLGLAIGWAAGRVVTAADLRGWALPQLVPIAPLVVAVATYGLVVALGGNGFVAAFVCGLGFGATSSRGAEEPPEHLMAFTEQVGLLLGFAVWFIFGAGVLEPAMALITWPMVGYGVLALTVLRMLPVAVSAIGLGLRWDTVLLAGWLGPRGLASIVFAILAFDDVGPGEGTFVITTIAVTVAMSVLAHGLSAGPLATWYSRRHPVVTVEDDVGAS
jgi:NhaP-type Na+/H+ or K+/H+ antiporter